MMMSRGTIMAFIIIQLLGSCTRTNPAGSNSVYVPDEPFMPSYALDDLKLSSVYTKPGDAVADVEGIDEISGMVAGIVNTGQLWMHNDGGDGSILYLLDESNGSKLTDYQVLGNNVDWEDIAISRDQLTNRSYLWIADIGDNLKIRSSYTLYKVEEPVFSIGSDTLNPNALQPFKAYSFNFPDGMYNSETLLIDPFSGEIILVTRGDNARVYTAHEPDADELNTLTLKYRGVLPIPGITGGDVSRNGNHILLRTYNEILLWERQPGQTVVEALSNVPELVPYITEPQGEAICWGINGYYTISEKVGVELPTLYYYAK